MSGRLVSSVLDSRLTHRLKMLAAVLASFGRDDGTSIRPSVATMARYWGRSERRVLAGLADLQRIGVLIVVRRHAPRRPTEYRLDLERMAALADPVPTWRQTARYQLRLPLFPQVFHSDGSRRSGKPKSFPHFHRRTHDDPASTPDASVTRSVRTIRTSTSTTRVRAKRTGTR